MGTFTSGGAKGPVVSMHSDELNANGVPANLEVHLPPWRVFTNGETFNFIYLPGLAETSLATIGLFGNTFPYAVAGVIGVRMVDFNGNTTDHGYVSESVYSDQMAMATFMLDFAAITETGTVGNGNCTSQIKVTQFDNGSEIDATLPFEVQPAAGMMKLNLKPLISQQRDRRVCVLYEPDTGAIQHVHHVVVLKGAVIPAQADVEERAFALMKRLAKVPASQLHALHTEYEHFKRGSRLRVDIKAKRIAAA